MPDMLAVDYESLIRLLARELGNGSVYARGTITVAAGVVTLTGGSWPDWAASAYINVGDNNYYNVSTRNSASSITLEDTSVTLTGARQFMLVQSSETDKVETAYLLDGLIDEGLRSFYFLTQEGDRGPHGWSFLNPVYSFSTETGKDTYDLPENFGQQSDEWVCFSEGTPYPLSLVSYAHLQGLLAGPVGDASTPRYVAVIPKPNFDGTASQQFQAVFAPRPDRAYSIQFRYPITPRSLSPQNPYPLGGPVHAETIRAAVLARAEMFQDCQGGQRAAIYQQRLAASIQHDRQAEKVDSISYPLTAPFDGTYEWLQQEIGAALSMSPNPVLWKHPEKQAVDSYIQQGMRMFYQPSMAIRGEHRSHKWSFLRPVIQLTFNAPYSTGTVAVANGLVTLTTGTWPTWAANGGELEIDGARYRVKARVSNSVVSIDNTTASEAAGTSYTLQHARVILPQDFAGIDGPLVYRGTASGNQIRMVDTGLLEAAKKGSTFSTGTPRAAAEVAVYPAEGERLRTSWELALYPLPDAEYTVWGRYKVSPRAMVPGDYILGGPEFYETALAACLAAADGKRIDAFSTRLASAIDYDQSEHAPQTVGINRVNSYLRRDSLSLTDRHRFGISTRE
jgi:hypothetical protein